MSAASCVTLADRSTWTSTLQPEDMRGTVLSALAICTLTFTMGMSPYPRKSKLYYGDRSCK